MSSSSTGQDVAKLCSIVFAASGPRGDAHKEAERALTVLRDSRTGWAHVTLPVVLSRVLSPGDAPAEAVQTARALFASHGASLGAASEAALPDPAGDAEFFFRLSALRHGASRWWGSVSPGSAEAGALAACASLAPVAALAGGARWAPFVVHQAWASWACVGALCFGARHPWGDSWVSWLAALLERASEAVDRPETAVAGARAAAAGVLWVPDDPRDCFKVISIASQELLGRPGIPAAGCLEAARVRFAEHVPAVLAGLAQAVAKSFGGGANPYVALSLAAGDAERAGGGSGKCGPLRPEAEIVRDPVTRQALPEAFAALGHFFGWVTIDARSVTPDVLGTILASTALAGPIGIAAMQCLEELLARRIAPVGFGAFPELIFSRIVGLLDSCAGAAQDSADAEEHARRLTFLARVFVEHHLRRLHGHARVRVEIFLESLYAYTFAAPTLATASEGSWPECPLGDCVAAWGFFFDHLVEQRTEAGPTAARLATVLCNKYESGAIAVIRGLLSALVSVAPTLDDEVDGDDNGGGGGGGGGVGDAQVSERHAFIDDVCVGIIGKAGVLYPMRAAEASLEAFRAAVAAGRYPAIPPLAVALGSLAQGMSTDFQGGFPAASAVLDALLDCAEKLSAAPADADADAALTAVVSRGIGAFVHWLSLAAAHSRAADASAAGTGAGAGAGAGTPLSPASSAALANVPREDFPRFAHRIFAVLHGVLAADARPGSDALLSAAANLFRAMVCAVRVPNVMSIPPAAALINGVHEVGAKVVSEAARAAVYTAVSHAVVEFGVTPALPSIEAGAQVVSGFLVGPISVVQTRLAELEAALNSAGAAPAEVPAASLRELAGASLVITSCLGSVRDSPIAVQRAVWSAAESPVRTIAGAAAGIAPRIAGVARIGGADALCGICARLLSSCLEAVGPVVSVKGGSGFVEGTVGPFLGALVGAGLPDGAPGGNGSRRGAESLPVALVGLMTLVTKDRALRTASGGSLVDTIASLALDAVAPAATRGSGDVDLLAALLSLCFQLVDNQWRHWFGGGVQPFMQQAAARDQASGGNGDPAVAMRVVMIPISALGARPEPSIARLSLSHLHALDERHSLFADPRFSASGARDSLLGTTLGACLARSHESVRDEAIDVLYAVARRDLNGFRTSFLPTYLNGTVGIPQSDAVALASNFSAESDAPTFEDSVNGLTDAVMEFLVSRNG